MAKENPSMRIGIDLGGTKIAAVALLPDGRMSEELRVPTPRNDYDATLEAIRQLVLQLETDTGMRGTVGVGMPGSISPATGRVQNSNSVWLNGQPFDRDLSRRLERPVRMANDANCFALSEATDGAAAGARSVFGVILGTGCGGGIVINGEIVNGPRGIGGEWGHNPLPWPEPDEYPGRRCWCGHMNCIERWVSGPALESDYAEATGERILATEVGERAEEGDEAARQALARHASRLARGLSHVVNIIDPEVIVLGGALSRLKHLYEVLPDLMKPYVLSDAPYVDIRPPVWGDASGVRGAAWLWGRPD
jgi:fructokinase